MDCMRFYRFFSLLWLLGKKYDSAKTVECYVAPPRSCCLNYLKLSHQCLWVFVISPERWCSSAAKKKSITGALTNAKKNGFNLIVSNMYIPSVKSSELQPLSSMYPYWQVKQSVENTAALFCAPPQDRCAFLVCPIETGVKQKCNIGT